MSRPSSRASSPSLPLQSTSMLPSQAPTSEGGSLPISPSSTPPSLSSPSASPPCQSLTAESTTYQQQLPTYYPPWLRQQQQQLAPTNSDPIYQNAPILSEYLETSFVPSVVPQPEEYAEKEKARQFLEGLAKQVCGNNVKLLPFGLVTTYSRGPLVSIDFQGADESNEDERQFNGEWICFEGFR